MLFFVYLQDYFSVKLKYPELIEPLVQFCMDAYKTMIEKTPWTKYDYYYRTFDNILYAGRDRKQRIVFEWLTPEEKMIAMHENVTSIESIVFPKEKNCSCSCKCESYTT